MALELGAKDDMDKSDIIIDVDRALTENTSSSDEFGIDDRALAVDSDGWILLFDAETGTYDTDTIETGDDEQDDDDGDDAADDVEWYFSGGEGTATLPDGQEWTFYRNKVGHVYCDCGDETRHHLLGSQICYGGGFMGDTLYEPNDHKFVAEVKKWMSQHLSPKM